jgi:hypothetical protein
MTTPRLLSSGPPQLIPIAPVFDESRPCRPIICSISEQMLAIVSSTLVVGNFTFSTRCSVSPSFCP